MCRIIKPIKIQKLAVQFYQLLLKLVSYSASYLYFTCLTPDDFTVGVQDRGAGGWGSNFTCQWGSSAVNGLRMKHSCWYLMLVIDHAFLEENILHSGCSPDTEPEYLHTICLNYFPHSFNMLKLYKINFSWIQASPRGLVVTTITLLVAYICSLSPGFFSLRRRRPFVSC
jgi:hypothetical protein